MPGFEIDFHSAAADEVAAAKRWYAERSEAAASAFLAELDRAIARIGDSPERWAEQTLATRRFLLRRFPFAIIYHVGASRITIVAVAHARRSPGYWQGR